MICQHQGSLKKDSSKILACLIWSAFHVTSGLCNNLLSLCDAPYLLGHHSLAEFPCCNLGKLQCSQQHALLTICRYEVRHILDYHCIVLQDLHQGSVVAQIEHKGEGKGKKQIISLYGIQLLLKTGYH